MVNGEDWRVDKFTCDDKSDQIFTIGDSCEDHQKRQIQTHNSHFCSQSWGICNNYTRGWLQSMKGEKFQDPHNCQASCKKPGPQCEACTNPDYFKCRSENICLHPDLRCDGHPQCPGAEDEDIIMCRKEKFRNKIETAFKCQSIMYKNMTIYARRCNFVDECQNRVDEIGCEDKISNMVTAVFCTMVLFIYLGITCHRNCSDEENEGDADLEMQEEARI